MYCVFNVFENFDKSNQKTRLDLSTSHNDGKYK